MSTFYRAVLLSHLSAISFDKPIESVLELAESDHRVLHFQDQRLFEMMKVSAKPGLKELYEKTAKNGWIIDMRNYTQQGRIYNSGQGGHLLDKQDINWRASQQIKKLNKKLFLRIKDPIITSPRSIVLPKNGAYTATFDKFIARAYDTGLLHKTRYQYQFRDGKSSKYFLTHFTFFSLDVIENFDWKKSADDSTQKPLTLKPFIAILSLSGVFYLVSIIVFLFEMLKK